MLALFRRAPALAAAPPASLVTPALRTYFEALSAEAAGMQERAEQLFASGAAREGTAVQRQLDGRRALVAAFVIWALARWRA